MFSKNSYFTAQCNRLDFQKDDNILFLQGPVGSFFSRFSSYIQNEVNSVTHVNFCTGDKIFNLKWPHIDYKNDISEWSEFLSELVSKNKITKVYLMNDCRPYHSIAVEVFKELGILFWVFEDGYFRPNHITLEAFGVNGNSCFESFKETPNLLEDDSFFIKKPVLNKNFERVIYSLASIFDIFLFKKYKAYRKIDPFSKFKEILCNYIIGIKKNSNSQIIKTNDKIILAILQVDDDTQIRYHSLFKSNLEFISFIIESVCQDNNSYHIIFKSHPLDFISTHKNEKNLHKLGVSNASFVYKSDLDQLMEQADKVICINSTAGMRAIQANKDTFLCGDAVYSRKNSKEINEIKDDLNDFLRNNFSSENFYDLDDLKNFTQIRASFYK